MKNGGSVQNSLQGLHTAQGSVHHSSVRGGGRARHGGTDRTAVALSWARMIRSYLRRATRTPSSPSHTSPSKHCTPSVSASKGIRVLLRLPSPLAEARDQWRENERGLKGGRGTRVHSSPFRVDAQHVDFLQAGGMPSHELGWEGKGVAWGGS